MQPPSMPQQPWDFDPNVYLSLLQEQSKGEKSFYMAPAGENDWEAVQRLYSKSPVEGLLVEKVVFYPGQILPRYVVTLGVAAFKLKQVFSTPTIGDLVQLLTLSEKNRSLISHLPLIKPDITNFWIVITQCIQGEIRENKLCYYQNGFHQIDIQESSKLEDSIRSWKKYADVY
jgi:hypothetical protein